MNLVFPSGDSYQVIHIFTVMLSNNDILKKLRVALSLRNEDIIEILRLVEFDISKGALGDFFRNEDHPGYVEAGDQVLRNFLNGLIIYKRGKLPDPKANLKEEDKAKPEKKR
jgi:uncharacterized protein YehS (DUF1456 family)